MNTFFLRLIGIDTYILSCTRQRENTGFVISGVITAFLFLLSFISSFYLMTYLVKGIILDFFIAVAFSSILFNFYRFTISSIIWRSPTFDKPEEVRAPTWSSTLLKVTSCSFFVFLVTKPIELWVFHRGIDKWLGPNIMDDHTLYRNFVILHQHYPITWLITTLMLTLFALPILYRSHSSKWGNKEYESKHFDTLIKMIELEFKWFETQYNELFHKNKICAAFEYEERCYNKKDKIIKLTAYRTQYVDPPFNTTLKEKIVNTKGRAMHEGTSMEFFHLLEALEIHSLDHSHKK